MQLFSLLIGLGTLAGLLLVSWRAPQKARLRYLDAAIFTLFGALLGSRIAAVVLDWAYYQGHPLEVIQVWKGGLSSIGALLGAIATILVLSFIWRIPLGALSDAMLPLAGALAISAWLGCWLAGCSYGPAVNSWWAIPARDQSGVLANRVPVQLAGALITLLLVWVLDWGARYFPVRGLAASLGIFGICAVLFGLSYLRTDPVPVWRGLRLDAWGALGGIVLSAVAVVVLLSWWKLKAKRNLPG